LNSTTGNCSACIANCLFCSTATNCLACDQNYQLAANSTSSCVAYITPGAAAGIALGVIGCVAGVVTAVFVFVKLGASTAATSFQSLPLSSKA